MREVLDKIIELLTSVLLTLMVLVCIWQIFSRYVLKSPSSGSEEFMRYGLIWVSLLGSPYAYGRGKHLAIIFAVKQMSPKAQERVAWIVEAAVVVFAVVVLIIGGIYTGVNAIGQVSAALGLPMQFLYFMAPVSGVFFIFYSISYTRDRLMVRKEVA
jgi:TRAP-type C4-dicarboxylate transport system permease small subunit